MTTPTIKTRKELEEWIRRLGLDDEQADEIRAEFTRAKRTKQA